MKEMDYQDVLSQQAIFGEELFLFSNKDMQKEVVIFNIDFNIDFFLFLLPMLIWINFFVYPMCICEICRMDYGKVLIWFCSRQVF